MIKLSSNNEKGTEFQTVKLKTTACPSRPTEVLHVMHSRIAMSDSLQAMVNGCGEQTVNYIELCLSVYFIV